MRKCILVGALLFSTLQIALSAPAQTKTAKPQDLPKAVPEPVSRAGCVPFEPSQPESLTLFLKAEIEALSLAHMGASAAIQGLEEKGEPIHQMTSQFNGLRENRKDDSCAAYLLAPYRASKNETVSMAAKLQVAVYQNLARTNDEALQLLRQSARARNVDPVSVSDQLSQLQTNVGELVVDLGNAATGSLLVAIDRNRTNAEGDADHMLLSRSERDDLLKYLHSDFPNLKDSGDENFAKQDGFEQVASLFQHFLTGTHKPSDE